MILECAEELYRAAEDNKSTLFLVQGLQECKLYRWLPWLVLTLWMPHLWYAMLTR